MGQTWTTDVFNTSHNWDTDMANIETNFATLRGLFSGGSAPSSPEAGMPWFDTTQKILKLRNQGNTAWLGVLYGDEGLKVWLHKNDVDDGWELDDSIGDRVLALADQASGGGDYDTVGGGVAGTWTQPGHTLTVSEMPAHTHSVSGTVKLQYFNRANPSGGSEPLAYSTVRQAFNLGGGANHTASDSWQDLETEESDPYEASYRITHNLTGASQGGDSSHNHGSTWRPAAAVGTLQHPDTEA